MSSLLAKIAVGRLPGKDVMRVVVQLPLAVNLGAPVELRVGDKVAVSASYETCYPNFCLAGAAFSDDAAQMFKKAAAMTIVLGSSFAGFVPFVPLSLMLPLAAFAGALLATLLVYRIATRDGRTDVATMLLAGVAVTALAGAGIGFMVFLSDDRELRDLNYWMLGSLGGITWGRLATGAPFVLAGVLLLPFFARPLNALLLGESEAGHLGFHVERTKRFIVVLAALGAGASVALTGVIGFVGLVVPHVVRLLAGPDHRLLLPVSILFGAALMLIADLLARTLVLPAELPIGILTACIGGPFFLWLLLRRRRGGGW